MTTIKGYTDINQSKKLAEILPLDSADMCYLWNGTSFSEYPASKQTIFKRLENIPCWSLAALLSVLPIIKGYRVEIRHIDKGYCCCYTEENNYGDLYWHYADNPVDACVDMVEMLNEYLL